MTIETKHNVNDKVFYLQFWFRFDNGVFNKHFKVCEGVIDSLRIGVTEASTNVGYYLKPGAMYMPETSVFKTRDECNDQMAKFLDEIWELANPLAPKRKKDAKESTVQGADASIQDPPKEVS